MRIGDCYRDFPLRPACCRYPWSLDQDKTPLTNFFLRKKSLHRSPLGITTSTPSFWLDPPWDKYISVYMTTEIALDSSHSPRLYHVTTHSHIHRTPSALPQHDHVPHDHMDSGPLVSLCIIVRLTRSQWQPHVTWPLTVDLLYVYPHTQCMWDCETDVLDPSVLAFRLWLYRHLYIYILLNSRFTSYNKQSNPWGIGFATDFTVFNHHTLSLSYPCNWSVFFKTSVHLDWVILVEHTTGFSRRKQTSVEFWKFAHSVTPSCPSSQRLN